MSCATTTHPEELLVTELDEMGDLLHRCRIWVFSFFKDTLVGESAR